MKSTNILNSKGITLIALVLTIIVLIILAGISVTFIMGENGLINRAKEQKIVQAKAEILQELELAKGPVTIEGNGYTSLEKYLTHISNNGLNSHKVTNINKIDDKNAEIVVDDKYVYTAAQIENNVTINEVGYIEDLYPEISSFIVKEKNSNSITVELIGRRAEEYEFYIEAPNGEYKKVTTEKIDKAQVNSFNTLTYTYEKLTSIAEDESYKLKVIAKRGSRQTEKEIDSNIEAIVPAEGNVTIVSSTSEWTNEKIITTVETKLLQYTIQYQIDATSETILDDSKWINYIEPIVSEKNEVIYIRLWDGVNAGEITSQEITKIDTDFPNDANIVLSAIKVEPNNEVKAQVALSDSKSDVKITSSKWVWTDSEDEVGLDASAYTGGTFSSNPQEISLDTTNEGTYYLHVLTVDNAGNMIETISESITVKLETIGVIYNVDTNVTYQEKVYINTTCLSPKTFTPTKEGWTFVGWREDDTATSTVLTSKVIETEPITLYAVFKQDVTVTYYNNVTTAAKNTQSKYYNNGNTVNPTFTIAQAAKSGWTARGWSTATTGNGAVAYSNLSNTAISSNVTLYGLYYKTVTLSYNGNGATSGSVATQSGTAYYNSAGNTVNPSFKIAANGFAKTSYAFGGWALGSATGTAYSAGGTITLASSNTLFAKWLSSTLTVYTRSNFSVAPTVNNTSYVTINSSDTGGNAGVWAASIWYRTGTSSTTTGNLVINRGAYKKATIVFGIDWVNCDHDGSFDRRAWATINGTTYAESPNGWDYAPNSVTISNTTATSIPVSCYAKNDDHNGTWCGVNVYVKSIVLSM